MSLFCGKRLDLRELMGPVAKEWDATTREPNPQWARDLLARLK